MCLPTASLWVFLKHGISCASCASEEMDDVVIFNDEISNNSKYSSDV